MATWGRSTATLVKQVARRSVRKVKVMAKATLVRRRLQQTGSMEDSALSQITMVLRMKGGHQVLVGVRDLLPQNRERTFQLP